MILKNIFYCTIENKFINNKHCELCFECYAEMPDHCIPSGFNQGAWAPCNACASSEEIGYSFDGINGLHWHS